MKEKKDLDINGKLDYFENFLLTQENYSVEERKDVKKQLSRFKADVKTKWLSANRNQELFLKKK